MTATTSAVKLRYKKETTFGTAPGGAYQEAPLSGETLNPNTTYTRSNVIRSDGQSPYTLLTNAEGGGTINGELQAGAWDDWFESVLLSRAWAASGSATAVSVTAVAPASGVPGYVNRASGDWSATFDQGGWVSFSGWTGGAAANNSELWKLVEVTATRLYVTGATLVAQGSAESVTITPLDDIVNGVTTATYHIEREYTDDTDEFVRFPGAGIAACGIDIPTADIITTSFDVISKLPTSNTSSNASSNTAASTSEAMASADVRKVLEGDPMLGNITSNGFEWDTSNFTLLQAQIRITPSLRVRPGIGTVGPALTHGRGDFIMTANLRLYYNTTSGKDDKALMNKVNAGSTSGFALVLTHQSKWYVFDSPRGKWVSGIRNAPAKSQDVIMEVGYESYLNVNDTNPNSNVSGVTYRIARV